MAALGAAALIAGCAGNGAITSGGTDSQGRSIRAVAAAPTPFPYPFSGNQYAAGVKGTALGVYGWGEFAVGPDRVVAMAINRGGSAIWRYDVQLYNDGSADVSGMYGFRAHVDSTGHVAVSKSVQADSDFAAAYCSAAHCTTNAGSGGPGTGGRLPAAAGRKIHSAAGCTATVAGIIGGFALIPETAGASLIVLAGLGGIAGILDTCSDIYAPAPGGGGVGGGSGSGGTMRCYIDGVQVNCPSAK
ncbi:MAG TPA: hypothetical protein VGD01_03360 [Candidatus Elarobacter sp.]